MKSKMEEIEKREMTNFGEKKISRKEAIKRTGYMAASAATMMILLSNPAQAGGRHGHQCSPASAPPRHGNNGFGNGDQDAPGNSGSNNNAENNGGRRRRH